MINPMKAMDYSFAKKMFLLIETIIYLLTLEMLYYRVYNDQKSLQIA